MILNYKNSVYERVPTMSNQHMFRWLTDAGVAHLVGTKALRSSSRLVIGSRGKQKLSIFLVGAVSWGFNRPLGPVYPSSWTGWVIKFFIDRGLGG